MLLELVENLIHLKRSKDRLDEHRRSDRPLRNTQLFLRHYENVVPQPRLEMALQLGQIEIWATAARNELLGVMEKVEREVEDAARDWCAGDFDVLLGQVPAARPHEQRGERRVQLVFLAFCRDVVDPAPDRVAQVDVALDVVVPFRRIGVLEVGHEYARARIESVDDHLAIDRSGDLDATVPDVYGNLGASPARLADRARFRQEAGQLAGVELALPCRASREQLRATPAERALQFGRESERLGR